MKPELVGHVSTWAPAPPQLSPSCQEGASAGAGSSSEPGVALLSKYPTCPGGRPGGRRTQREHHREIQVFGAGGAFHPGLRKLFDFVPALFFVLLEHNCGSPGGLPLRPGAKVRQGRRSSEDKSGRTGKPGEEARK